jgi:hypothetical protein
LSGSTRSFSRSVALFDLCRAQAANDQGELWQSWTFLAAQTGILALYNFRLSLEGLHRNFRVCRTWGALVNNAAIERARKQFRERFPNTRELRQAIMHSGELYWNAERTNNNAITRGLSDGDFEINPGSVVAIGNLFRGSTYSTSFAGTLHSYDLTGENARFLVALTAQCFEAVAPISLR